MNPEFSPEILKYFIHETQNKNEKFASCTLFSRFTIVQFLIYLMWNPCLFVSQTDEFLTSVKFEIKNFDQLRNLRRMK